MAATIFGEKCNSCGFCVGVCPHQIIVIPPNEPATLIDEEKCIECGACSLQCPSGAILTHPLGCRCVKGILKSRFRKVLGITPVIQNC
ncbi:MAG: 4Fe-4S binding protein [Candidatus Heimdallarchaeota archaeon]